MTGNCVFRSEMAGNWPTTEHLASRLRGFYVGTQWIFFFYERVNGRPTGEGHSLSSPGFQHTRQIIAAKQPGLRNPRARRLICRMTLFVPSRMAFVRRKSQYRHELFEGSDEALHLINAAARTPTDELLEPTSFLSCSSASSRVLHSSQIS